MITDNENKIGWYLSLRELRALVYKLIADKEKENNIYWVKKNYEKDRPQLYKKILLVKQEYVLQNCKNQIINFQIILLHHQHIFYKQMRYRYIFLCVV